MKPSKLALAAPDALPVTSAASCHRLRNTLLHELCHVAVWMIDGIQKPPHGKRFKYWAKKAMRAVPDIRVTTYHDYEIRKLRALAYPVYLA
jgi:predicted SprT family Zn-dependent metalloprotease